MDHDKVYEMLENKDKLPVLSQELKEILYMLQYHEDIDVDILVYKISELEDFNKSILNSLNNGYFHLGKRITSVRDAIMLLGLKTVQNLLIFFITRKLFPEGDQSRHSFDMGTYWKHVLGTSVAASLLSTRLNKGDKNRLFTYGLVHDIGIPVMDACMPAKMDQVGQKIKSGVHQLVAERSAFGGLSHSEIGGWICRQWNIREDVIHIVEYHHTPFFAKEYCEEVLMMHMADVISTEYGAQLLGGKIYRRISERIMNQLGANNEDYEYIHSMLPKELEKVKYLLAL